MAALALLAPGATLRAQDAALVSAARPLSLQEALALAEGQSEAVGIARADVARADVHRWFTTVYHNPAGTDACGVHGTPEQVREKLETLIAGGATHLLLNPVARYAEVLEALAPLVSRRP